VPSFAQLCQRLVGAGVRLAVDTSGPALRAAAIAGAALLKPNRDELAEAVGMALDSMSDVVEAARQLRSLGAGAVLASLGADGAVLVDGDGVIAGIAPVAQPRSAVGAGDALLAGFLAAGARGEYALAQALAWGAAAVSLPGSRMPGPAEVSRHTVRIHPPDQAFAALPTGPNTAALPPKPVPASPPESDKASLLPQAQNT
jgi:1-phosphofructokinase